MRLCDEVVWIISGKKCVRIFDRQQADHVLSAWIVDKSNIWREFWVWLTFSMHRSNFEWKSFDSKMPLYEGDERMNHTSVRARMWMETIKFQANFRWYMKIICSIPLQTIKSSLAHTLTWWRINVPRCPCPYIRMDERQRCHISEITLLLHNVDKFLARASSSSTSHWHLHSCVVHCQMKKNYKTKQTKTKCVKWECIWAMRMFNILL